MKKSLLLKIFLLLCLSGTSIGNVSAQEEDPVKWKLIDIDNEPLPEGEVVAIVDLATGRAMSNDKGTKAPGAVEVELNYDKDRLLGDVPENVEWTLTVTVDGMQFSTTTTDDGGQTQTNYLYADSKGLKVGTNDNKNFDVKRYGGVAYLHTSVKSKDSEDYTEYLGGVSESMFSSSWKLAPDTLGNKPDDKVANTRFAIFKKEVGQQAIQDMSQFKFPCDNYEINVETIGTTTNLFYEVTGFRGDFVEYYSSDPDIADVVNNNAEPYKYGQRLLLKKPGTIQLIARIPERDERDKAVTYCTIRINETGSEEKGSENNPLTVTEAITLAKGGEVEGITLEEGRNYFIKGKVNKANNGLLGAFGDLGLDEIMGDDMDMEDRLGDIDDIDLSSLGSIGGTDISKMIPGLGDSDGMDFYISDDGTKDNRIKVQKCRGIATLTTAETTENGHNTRYGYPTCDQVSFEKLEDVSPGDIVVVYGPLIFTEDSNLFAGLGGSSKKNNEEGEEEDPDANKTVKVGELNYVKDLKQVLKVNDQILYEGRSKNLTDDEKFFYVINSQYKTAFKKEGAVLQPQIKSSDEDVAKWVYTNDEKTDSVFTAVSAGNATVTVKVKVILPSDSNDESAKEKSYTMKRKFNLKVNSIDKTPEGKNAGEYIDVQHSLKGSGIDRILIVGTRTNDEGTPTDYVLGKNNAMMGGGKEGKTVEIKESEIYSGHKCILFDDVPKGAQEILLEEEGDYFLLNVGENENGEKLYLYASDSTKDSSEGNDYNEESDFDFSQLIEMIMPSSGLKVGTREAVGDSCLATITIGAAPDYIATIKFNATEGKKNTVMLTSAFDLGGLMNIFGESEEEEEDESSDNGNATQTGSGSTMNFDFFMPAFNTKTADDEKGFKTRIFGFEQYYEYKITIGPSGWMTFVSDFDVKPVMKVDDENNEIVYTEIEAYAVTKVTPGSEKSWASLERTNYETSWDKAFPKLAGGVPYLLHAEPGSYIMRNVLFDDPYPAPDVNLLQISDKTTAGLPGESTVYILANKSNGVGFYRWAGGPLGSGRVYLSVEDSDAGANEFCDFNIEETTDGIQTVDSTETVDTRYYDLQGRRVEKPTKGVYVVDGKKVVIK